MAFTPNASDAIFIEPFGDIDTSQASNSSAFNMGVDERDNGVCMVCGFDDSELLRHHHIIPLSETNTVSYSFPIFIRSIH